MLPVPTGAWNLTASPIMMTFGRRQRDEGAPRIVMAFDLCLIAFVLETEMSTQLEPSDIQTYIAWHDLTADQKQTPQGTCYLNESVPTFLWVP